jgi:hypothetical protein
MHCLVLMCGHAAPSQCPAVLLNPPWPATVSHLPACRDENMTAALRGTQGPGSSGRGDAERDQAASLALSFQETGAQLAHSCSRILHTLLLVGGCVYRQRREMAVSQCWAKPSQTSINLLALVYKS